MIDLKQLFSTLVAEFVPFLRIVANISFFNEGAFVIEDILPIFVGGKRIG